MRKIKKWWLTLRKKPYVELINEGSEEGGIYPIELDWNDYFIEDLAKNGISADSDEEAVRLWLTRIMRAEDYDQYEQTLLAAAEKQAREG